MTISELVEKLEDIRAKEGDISVVFETSDRRWTTPVLDIANEYEGNILLLLPEAEKGGLV